MTATDTTIERVSALELIPVSLIDPDPENRKDEPDDALIASVRERGVEQPIIVRAVGDRYEIIAGERRWRASIAADRTHVPSIIREPVDEADRLELQGDENLQRQDLHPLDEGQLFARLCLAGRSQQQVADRYAGGSQPFVSKRMNLHLRLGDDAKTLFREGRLLVKEAEGLAQLHDTPSLVAELLKEARKTEPGPHQHIAYWKVENALRERQRAKAEEATRKKLEKAGIRVLDDDAWDADTVHPLGSIRIWDVAVDPDAHASEPCHVAHIGYGGEAEFGCTDRDRHRPSGESTLKADNLTDVGIIDPDDPEVILDDDGEEIDPDNPPPPGATADERRDLARAAHEQRNVEAQEAINARRAVVRQLLTVGYDRTAAAELIGVVLVEVAAAGYLEEQVAGIAIDLLGGVEITDLDKVMDDDGYGTDLGHGPAFRRLAATRGDAAVLAAACALVEESISNIRALADRYHGPWASPTVDAYHAFLASHGWNPSAIEAEAIEGAKPIRAARDPHPFDAAPLKEGAAITLCKVCDRSIDIGPHPIQEGEHRRLADDDDERTAVCSCGWTSTPIAKRAGKSAYDTEFAQHTLEVNLPAGVDAVELDPATTTYTYTWTSGTDVDGAHLMIRAQDAGGNVAMVPIDAPLLVGAPPERSGKGLGFAEAEKADRKGALARILAEHVLRATARKPQITAVAKLLADKDAYAVSHSAIVEALGITETTAPEPAPQPSTTDVDEHHERHLAAMAAAGVTQADLDAESPLSGNGTSPDDEHDDGMPRTYALTRARLEALRVLAFADAVGQRGAKATTITTTSFEGADVVLKVLAVHANWLTAEGLATRDIDTVTITAEGRRVALEEELLAQLELTGVLEPRDAEEPLAPSSSGTSSADAEEDNSAPAASADQVEPGIAPENDPLPAAYEQFVVARSALESSSTSRKNRPAIVGAFEDAKTVLAAAFVSRHPDRTQLLAGLAQIGDAGDAHAAVVALLEAGGPIGDAAAALRTDKRPSTRVGGLLKHLYVEDLDDAAWMLGGVDLDSVGSWITDRWPDMSEQSDDDAAAYVKAAVDTNEWSADDLRTCWLIETSNAGVGWDPRPKLLATLKAHIGARTS